MNDLNTLFVTPKQVQAALALGRASLYRRLKDGSIPAVRVGRLLRIPRAALETLAAEASNTAKAGTNRSAPKAR